MTPHSPLFRQGFLDAQNTPSPGGDIIIPPHAGLTTMVIASLSLIIAILALLVFGDYTRKTQLEGMVIPAGGLINITSNRDGYVDTIPVQQGQRIQAEQALIRLSDHTRDGNGQHTLSALLHSLTLQHTMIEHQEQQERATFLAQQQAAEKHTARLHEELASARHALTLTENKARLAASIYARYQQLQSWIAVAELQQQEMVLADAQNAVEQQRQLQQRLQRDIETLSSELTIQQQQHLIRLNDLARQQENLRQQRIELNQQRAMTMMAPVSGEVAAIMVKPGQAVKTQDLLLSLLPEQSTLHVELYAPSRAVGFIRPGQHVGLRFTAYPYEKFGVQQGNVAAMTQVSLQASDMRPGQVAHWKENESHYRITVTLDKPTITAYGMEQQLKPGMTVSATVELDKRRLYEWLFEPLWSLKGKI